MMAYYPSKHYQTVAILGQEDTIRLDSISPYRQPDSGLKAVDRKARGYSEVHGKTVAEILRNVLCLAMEKVNANCIK